MDPAIAAAAVALIAPYLARAGEAFAGKAGEAAWARAEHLYRLIRGKLAADGDPFAEATLQRLAEQPTNKQRQDALAGLLAAKGHQDPRFGEEVNRAVQVAIHDSSVRQAMTNFYGNAWVGTVTTVGRDQIIIQGTGGDSALSVFGRAGAGPRVLMIIGGVVGAVGFAMFAFFVLSFILSVFQALQTRAPPRIPDPIPWVPWGFALFVVGAVVVVVGILWAASTRRG